MRKYITCSYCGKTVWDSLWSIDYNPNLHKCACNTSVVISAHPQSITHHSAMGWKCPTCGCGVAPYQDICPQCVEERKNKLASIPNPPIDTSEFTLSKNNTTSVDWRSIYPSTVSISE